MNENKDLLKINFGDIDGMYDPNLSFYFVDRDYWNGVIDSTKYFVIGRKGTGKSALYTWLCDSAYENGVMCKNILFNDFPFQVLLGLKDDSFVQPNQYQTVCRNMILNEFVRLIVSNENHTENNIFTELKKFL